MTRCKDEQRGPTDLRSADCTGGKYDLPLSVHGVYCLVGAACELYTANGGRTPAVLGLYDLDHLCVHDDIEVATG